MFKFKANNLNLSCSHCGGQGHLVERCYQLIRFSNKGSGPKNGVVKSKPTVDSTKYASNSTCVGSIFNYENVVLTSDMYDKLVRLLNS